MGFFPEQELTEAETAQLRYTPPEWQQPPEDELPGIVPQAVVLASAPQLVLYLAGIEAYSSGAVFRLGWKLRRGDADDEEWGNLLMKLDRLRHWGKRDNTGRLRLGVELSDGRRVVSGETPLWGQDEGWRPDGHVLTLFEQGGGGSDESRNYTGFLWLWPLPPAGTLRLVCEWTAFGIDEHSIDVSGDAIREAAGRARKI